MTNGQLSKIESKILEILAKIQENSEEKTTQIEGLDVQIQQSFDTLTMGQDRSKATILTHLNRLESVLNLTSEKVLILNQNVNKMTENKAQEFQKIEQMLQILPKTRSDQVSQLKLGNIQTQIEESMSDMLDLTTNKLIDAFEMKLADFLIQNGLSPIANNITSQSETNSLLRGSFNCDNGANNAEKKPPLNKNAHQPFHSPKKPRKRQSEGKQSENTPENLGQSIQNRINSRKIMQLGENTRKSSNPNSENKKIKSEYRASDTLEDRLPKPKLLSKGNPIKSTIDLNKPGSPQKRASPRKKSSKPKIPNTSRHSPNKRKRSHKKSVIDELIASHKATTEKMERLNLTISPKKTIPQGDIELVNESGTEIVQVNAFESQIDEPQIHDLQKFEGIEGESVKLKLKQDNVQLEDNQNILENNGENHPRRLPEPDKKQLLNPGIPGRGSNSPKSHKSRNSSQGKSVKSKISSKTIVSTYVDGNQYFNFQKCKWAKNGGSKSQFSIFKNYIFVSSFNCRLVTLNGR